MLFDYFNDVANGIEFLIAFGSIVGLIGVLIGILGVVLSDSRIRVMFAKVLIVSFILLLICGGTATGVKYFHIH